MARLDTCLCDGKMGRIGQMCENPSRHTGGDFSDETLKWEFAEKEVGGSLVPTNFAKCDGAWAVSMRFFDSSGSGRRLDRSLSAAERLFGKVDARGLATD